MPLAFDFICSLPNGVHARPAGALAKTARRFNSEITLTNTRTGQSADSKSVLAVISAGIRQSDTCRLSVSGSDEATALTALSNFLARTFPLCDNSAPQIPQARQGGQNPAASEWATTGIASVETHDPLHPGLVDLNTECKTRADAIRRAVHLLHAADRTRHPRELEHALWQREAASPTGIGHGFAIPHCRSDAVQLDSLVILKPRAPVDWNSPDCELVRFIILLATRKTDGHKTVFPQVARQLMAAEFRERLAAETDPVALLVYLRACLNLESCQRPLRAA